MIDCNEWKTEKGHESTNMGKLKRLELWWQLYVTWLPVRDLGNFRPLYFCWTEGTVATCRINALSCLASPLSRLPRRYIKDKRKTFLRNFGIYQITGCHTHKDGIFLLTTVTNSELLWSFLNAIFIFVCYINLLKPTGHVMHQQFDIQQLYALPTLYLCVLYLSENKQRLVPLTA